MAKSQVRIKTIKIVCFSWRLKFCSLWSCG